MSATSNLTGYFSEAIFARLSEKPVNKNLVTFQYYVNKINEELVRSNKAIFDLDLGYADVLLLKKLYEEQAWTCTTEIGGEVAKGLVRLHIK
jgi:hypothetical protein